MNILYFCEVDLQRANSIGVLKKVYGQMNCLVKNGHEVDYINFIRNTLTMKNINVNREYIIDTQSKLDSYEKLINIVKENSYDVIYIRYTFSNYYVLRFLDAIKSCLPNIKIILEIPTYPYDGEMEIHEKTLFIDRYFRKYLKEYVNLIVLWNNYDEVFGIPTINVKNGVDLDTITVHKPKSVNDNIIKMITVANISRWHGYDRIIEGLKLYYQNDNEVKVFFYIVGEGAELNNLKMLVSKLNLEKYVIFTGAKKNEDLDECYNECQVAIGALGVHRVGMNNRSTLKSVEYCSKGIPFVVGNREENFEDDFPYMMEVSSSEEPIDIYKIIHFYRKIQYDKDLIDNMREYAENNLTWDVTMKPLLKILE